MVLVSALDYMRLAILVIIGIRVPAHQLGVLPAIVLRRLIDILAQYGLFLLVVLLLILHYCVAYGICIIKYLEHFSHHTHIIHGILSLQLRSFSGLVMLVTL